MKPARFGVTAIAGSALLAFAAPASAQFSTTHYGWSAWHGCWHADGAPAEEVLCIVPDADGVRMITIVDGVARDESRIVADDRARDVVQDNCRGTQRARWSNDHRRVFFNSELTCASNERRTSSGLIAFQDENHWISVQAITINGQTGTRSTQYTLARSANVPDNLLTQLGGDQFRAPARQYDAVAINDDDVSEAAANIDDAAVQEWLHASGMSYDVATGSALDQMNGGVRVIERPVYVVHYSRPLVRVYWSFWGWDPWRWQVYHGPYAVFHNRSRYYPARPVIIRRGPTHDNDYRDSRYNRNRDDNRNYRNDNNRDNRSGNHLRLTREGYTDDRGSSSQPPRVSQPQPDRAAGIRVPPPREPSARVAQPRDRAARQPQAQPVRGAVSRDRRGK